ncbi:CGNR zinc finger domain-containing protein [Streptomyces sp. P9(2023)]|uniref:CGNR zinc finger domain-containing protein n=1 Tax=Streptomyces sp. P9(2023) TaxID=3064394 RepID=UPI0028F4093F|nr:CGNR zinc finger domain-containing protein [Streptomyces sp. P9(2023)]MDT9689327.1 CGNR zinc finger domain-containing protein [Streptomyces sp. P9(2023)]
MTVRFESGRICLDLAAQPLGDTGALDHFLHAAGLVPAATPLRALDPAWVVRFRELRDCVGELVHAQLDGRRADRALERINALAAASAPPAPRAVRTETGRLVRALDTEPDCRALLAAVARDAVDLLTDPTARAQLRRCERDDCRRCYLDTSRGRRRRWCSSEACGNRARVARHRAARRADAAV